MNEIKHGNRPIPREPSKTKIPRIITTSRGVV